MKPIYRIGNIVYFVTDLDNIPYIVTGITIRIGHIEYLVSTASGTEKVVFDFEISKEKTIH